MLHLRRLELGHRRWVHHFVGLVLLLLRVVLLLLLALTAVLLLFAGAGRLTFALHGSSAIGPHGTHLGVVLLRVIVLDQLEVLLVTC